jgi:hypothetical protein
MGVSEIVVGLDISPGLVDGLQMRVVRRVFTAGMARLPAVAAQHRRTP